MNIALITGITGQDGSYLAELLLQKKYIVYGIIRRASDINTQRIDHLYNNKNLELRYGDLCDSLNILKIIEEIKGKYRRPETNQINLFSNMKKVTGSKKNIVLGEKYES